MNNRGLPRSFWSRCKLFLGSGDYYGRIRDFMMRMHLASRIHQKLVENPALTSFRTDQKSLAHNQAWKRKEVCSQEPRFPSQRVICETEDACKNFSDVERMIVTRRDLLNWEKDTPFRMKLENRPAFRFAGCRSLNFQLSRVVGDGLFQVGTTSRNWNVAIWEQDKTLSKQRVNNAACRALFLNNTSRLDPDYMNPSNLRLMREVS